LKNGSADKNYKELIECFEICDTIDPDQLLSLNSSSCWFEIPGEKKRKGKKYLTVPFSNFDFALIFNLSFDITTISCRSAYQSEKT